MLESLDKYTWFETGVLPELVETEQSILDWSKTYPRTLYHFNHLGKKLEDESLLHRNSPIMIVFRLPMSVKILDRKKNSIRRAVECGKMSYLVLGGNFLKTYRLEGDTESLMHLYCFQKK